MHNPLKRQSSVDDFNDPSFNNNKRTKHTLNDALSPHLHSYTDHQSLNASHLPPSPPIMVDTPLPSLPLPSPLSAACIDSIPTLQRFTITTRQQQQQQQPYDDSTSDYANINQILYEAHVERNKDSFNNQVDTDMMMDDGINYYDYANAVLRQAFLQRHPSPS